MECGGKHSAPHRGRLRRPLVATALKPLLIFSARGTRLLGGNRGVQKCDSVDPLSLVIKCLGEGGVRIGGLDSPDVRQTTLSPRRPSQHTHFDRGLRERFPAPTDLPMLPENMPYYRGPRVVPPPSAEERTTDVNHCQPLFTQALTHESNGLCHLSVNPVTFGEFSAPELTWRGSQNR